MGSRTHSCDDYVNITMDMAQNEGMMSASGSLLDQLNGAAGPTPLMWLAEQPQIASGRDQ